MDEACSNLSLNVVRSCMKKPQTIHSHAVSSHYLFISILHNFSCAIGLCSRKFFFDCMLDILDKKCHSQMFCRL